MAQGLRRLDRLQEEIHCQLSAGVEEVWQNLAKKKQVANTKLENPNKKEQIGKTNMEKPIWKNQTTNFITSRTEED